jgi:hypothetical protein
MEFIKQFSKLYHIIFYCVHIDLNSWKNVLPRMNIDFYCKFKRIVIIYCHHYCRSCELGIQTYHLMHQI